MARYFDIMHEKLDWIVSSRYKAHLLGAELYKLLYSETERVQIAGNPLARRAAADLTGIVYSLWRAAFLADDPHDASVERNLDNAFKFLHQIVHNNAITYSDERTSRIWTFGFYLNNARYRLEKLLREETSDGPMKNLSASLKETKCNEEQETIFSALKKSSHVFAHRSAAWEIYYQAAEIGLKCLTKHRELQQSGNC